MTQHNRTIPALVVSGFLGAGKTTLVRSLLERAQTEGDRLAVISNEFGELGIDQALLQSAAADAYVELEGGCVCCQLSNELLTTLQDLWERANPDRIIVETSGVALPFDTLLTFWREPVSTWVEECLAIVVVNAEQVVQKRDLDGTFEQQVSSADLLILNKLDLIPPEEIPHVEEVLAGMAPDTPVIRSMNGDVDPALLFLPSPDLARVRGARASCDEGVPHSHEHFHTEVLSVESDVAEDALMARFQAMDALRIKGVVQTASGLRLVQGVGPRIDLVPIKTPLPAHLTGKVVVIQRA